MSYFKQRMCEPSSWVGLSAVLAGIGGLVASKGTDPMAYAQIIGGAIAVVKPEGANQVKGA